MQSNSSRLNESISKHIAFSPTELEAEFSDLRSPQVSKRTRESQIRVVTKRSKSQTKETSRLRVQLVSEVTGQPEYFPCFNEEEVILEETVKGQVASADCDDDCQTDEEQVSDAVASLTKSLVKALKREERKGKGRRQ